MANPRREPTPQPVIDAIETELLSGKSRSRAAIARHHEISVSTVQRIARRLGIETEVWKTDHIRAATAAAIDRRRAERSDLADLLQRRARELLRQMDGPFLVFNFGGKDNTYEEHTLDGPPTGDIKNLMHAAVQALGKALDIDQMDHRPDDGAADDTLGKFFEGVATAYELIKRGPGATSDRADTEEAP